MPMAAVVAGGAIAALLATALLTRRPGTIGCLTPRGGTFGTLARLFSTERST